MAKLPHCAETTHRSKAAIHLNNYIAYNVGTLARLWDLN